MNLSDSGRVEAEYFRRPVRHHIADQLAVIDQLLVGPVQVTSRRIETPYVVVQNGEQHTNTLIYSFPEPVFSPKAQSSHNLAAVITALLIDELIDSQEN